MILCGLFAETSAENARKPALIMVSTLLRRSIGYGGINGKQMSYCISSEGVMREEEAKTTEFCPDCAGPIPMTERDPKREPSVDDVLRCGPWTRTVTGIGGMSGYQIRYTRTHIRTGHSEQRTCHTHEGWWRWAKNATVIERAKTEVSNG